MIHVENDKPFIVVLVGPTAVGKTEFSIELAKNITAKLSVEIQCKFIKIWTSAQQNNT